MLQRNKEGNIVDKNGKLFGKISIIDLLVILAVIIGAFGFSVRFFSNAAESVNQKLKFEYVVEIEDIRQYTVSALEKKGIVKEKKSDGVIGEIIAVESEPFKRQLALSNGRIVSVVVPERYVVRVTIAGEGNNAQNGYYIGENAEISVGSTVTIVTKYANTTGKIVSVNIIDE